jgi:hypothetical protein
MQKGMAISSQPDAYIRRRTAEKDDIEQHHKERDSWQTQEDDTKLPGSIEI